MRDETLSHTRSQLCLRGRPVRLQSIQMLSTPALPRRAPDATVRQAIQHKPIGTRLRTTAEPRWFDGARQSFGHHRISARQRFSRDWRGGSVAISFKLRQHPLTPHRPAVLATVCSCRPPTSKLRLRSHSLPWPCRLPCMCGTPEGLGRRCPKAKRSGQSSAEQQSIEAAWYPGRRKYVTWA